MNETEKALWLIVVCRIVLLFLTASFIFPVTLNIIQAWNSGLGAEFGPWFKFARFLCSKFHLLLLVVLLTNSGLLTWVLKSNSPETRQTRLSVLQQAVSLLQWLLVLSLFLVGIETAVIYASLQRIG